MKILALDLSLTATGLYYGNPLDPSQSVRTEIGTPGRRKDEPDLLWNARRYRVFSDTLLSYLQEYRPEVLVVEATTHAYPMIRKGGKQIETTRGMEFRAGLGLGRAMGWLDGVLLAASAFGAVPARVETIDAGLVKLRVAGARHASKATAREFLERIFGWDLTGWKESESDALACAVAWVREQEGGAVERMCREIGGSQDEPGRLAKLRSRSTPRRRTGSPVT